MTITIKGKKYWSEDELSRVLSHMDMTLEDLEE